MKYLLLLSILVLVVCLMNSKDLMKSVSTKAKSLKMDNTTMLVVGFVVIVLFMCMSKSVEGFKMVETDSEIANIDADSRFTGLCSGDSNPVKISGGPPESEGSGGDSIWAKGGALGAHPYVNMQTDLYNNGPETLDATYYNYNNDQRFLYGCLADGGVRAQPESWKNIVRNKVDTAGLNNEASQYCIDANQSEDIGGSTKLCSRFGSSDCVGEWSACNPSCQKTYRVRSPARGGGTECEAADGAPGTCQPGEGGEGGCPRNVNCGGTWSPCTAACEDASQRTFTTTTKRIGEGAACPAAVDCQAGEGACPEDMNCQGSWGPCNDSCLETYTISRKKRGQGRDCNHQTDDTRTCKAGEGACPRDLDCAGSWGECQNTGLTGNNDCKRWFTPSNSSSGTGTPCAAVASNTWSDAESYGGSDVFSSGEGCATGVSGNCPTASQAAIESISNATNTFLAAAGDAAGQSLADQLGPVLGPALDNAINTLSDDADTLLRNLNNALESYIAMNPRWLAAATSLSAVSELTNNKDPITTDKANNAVCALTNSIPGAPATCSDNFGQNVGSLINALKGK